MDSGIINLSTGPVQLTQEVKQALTSNSIPHRSNEAKSIFRNITALLRKEYRINDCFILTGSGTLANEVMLFQVKSAGGKGLILSNGEFGERLASQATRIGLDFLCQKQTWGEPLNLEETERLIRDHVPNWLVFTHCETSTGMVNDLKSLIELAQKYKCSCYVDCMSTIGTGPIDLSQVAMATASSGKGFASIAGLAFVFSNIQPANGINIPSYFDLGLYAARDGIPFTLSSNQLQALYCSLEQKLQTRQYALVDTYRKKISGLLAASDLIPYYNDPSHVLTLVPTSEEYHLLLEAFERASLKVSFESDYLRKRNWIQLAFFNFYTEKELCAVKNKLEGVVQHIGRQRVLSHSK